HFKAKTGKPGGIDFKIIETGTTRVVHGERRAHVRAVDRDAERGIMAVGRADGNSGGVVDGHGGADKSIRADEDRRAAVGVDRDAAQAGRAIDVDNALRNVHGQVSESLEVVKLEGLFVEGDEYS